MTMINSSRIFLPYFFLSKEVVLYDFFSPEQLIYSLQILIFLFNLVKFGRLFYCCDFSCRFMILYLVTQHSFCHKFDGAS